MRDIAVLIFLIFCIGAAFRHPWWGVLGLAVFSYMNPHAYAFGFMYSFPTYQVLFITFGIAVLTSHPKMEIPKDGRVYAFFILWFLFFLTTLNAKVPWAAWPFLLNVTKIFIPLVFTLLLIDTRDKLYYLIITIAGSFGILAMKGGIFAIKTGFGHRIYGPPGTQFDENNAFAIAVLMNIPLLVLWYRETKNKYLKFVLAAAIPLSAASAISSQSRGALLTLIVLTLLFIWHSKRKYLALPLVVAGLIAVSGALPEKWYNRMYTIETYETDASAQGRLVAWKDGIEFAIKNPLLGSGFEGWRWVTIKDWHNSYVEMMAEHGLIAFSLWMFLLWGTILSLTRLARLGRKYKKELPWITNYSTMIRMALLAYATGTMFLGLSYWDIMYHLVFIAVLLKKFAHEEIDALNQKQTEENAKSVKSAREFVVTRKQINEPS